MQGEGEDEENGETKGRGSESCEMDGAVKKENY